MAKAPSKAEALKLREAGFAAMQALYERQTGHLEALKAVAMALRRLPVVDTSSPTVRTAVPADVQSGRAAHVAVGRTSSASADADNCCAPELQPLLHVGAACEVAQRGQEQPGAGPVVWPARGFCQHIEPASRIKLTYHAHAQLIIKQS